MSGWRHALSWFPGHVAKATREMAERLEAYAKEHASRVQHTRDAKKTMKQALEQGRLTMRAMLTNRATTNQQPQQRPTLKPGASSRALYQAQPSGLMTNRGQSMRNLVASLSTAR